MAYAKQLEGKDEHSDKSELRNIHIHKHITKMQTFWPCHYTVIMNFHNKHNFLNIFH